MKVGPQLTEYCPSHLALLALQRRELEYIPQYGSIQDLDTNVAVQKRGNHRADEVNGVAEGLKRVTR